MTSTEAARDRVARHSGTTNLWNGTAITDKSPRGRRTLLETREHDAAAAAVKGPEWYAHKLLEFQCFPNGRFASRVLIDKSKRLIKESQSRIVITKNILAFHRPKRKLVN